MDSAMTHRLLKYTQVLVPVLLVLLLISYAAIGQDSFAAVSQEGGVGTAKVAEEGTDIYTESIAALTKLFVLAVLVESALTLLFNWRVFLTFFNRKGWKTIIAFAVSLIVVKTFDIDIVERLMNVYGSGPPQEGSVMTEILTAMILAGGSSAVNNIFIALGFRSRKQETAPQPPSNEAWIAIHVTADKASSKEKLVRVYQDSSATHAKHEAIAGSITRKNRLRDLFFPNPNRFPKSGGYTVEAGEIYRISVTGTDEQGNPVVAMDETYSFAPKAIVDFDVTL